MNRKAMAIGLATITAVNLAACGSTGTESGDSSVEAPEAMSTSEEEQSSAESSSETAEAESSDESSTEDVVTTTTGATGNTIELEYGMTGEQLKAFEEIIQGFTDETGIGISITQPGNGYENAMKTRMASGDLPDIWVTHGWSVIRYSEYLMPLEDQDWYSKIDESLLPSITDEDGHIYVLPVTEAVCGIIYNKNVMDKAGIDVSAIRTWDDFTNACATIKEKEPEVSPIFMSCNDAGVNSYTLECIFPTYLTNSDVKDSKADELKDGTFDFTTEGLDTFNLIAKWADSGYMNEDALTADLTTAQKAIGSGEAGFMFYSTECIPPALTYNPDANIGVMPACAPVDGQMSYFGVGEGNASCFGIWKDTEYEDECKQFLEYMSRPENADRLATDVDGGIPCLSDSQIKDAYVLNAFKEAQSQFKGDLTYDNFFDRSYQPSGMWSVFDDSMDILLEGTASDNVNAAAENMQTNYTDLSE